MAERSLIPYISLLILFGTLSPPAGYAQQNPQAMFDKANKLLNSRQHMQAIQGYHELENRQHFSGALFLNMGIAYQRIDSLGKAKYYYLKSATFKETETKARQALEYVNTQFSHQSAVLPKLPWEVAIDWLNDHIGARALLGAGLIVFNIGILLFIACWFYPPLPKGVKALSYTFIGLAILVMATAFYTQYTDNRYSTAVMITGEASVTETPRESASLVSRAFEGYTFTVDHKRSEAQSSWSYVRMSNGLYGWIPTEEIMVL